MLCLAPGFFHQKQSVGLSCEGRIFREGRRLFSSLVWRGADQLLLGFPRSRLRGWFRLSHRCRRFRQKEGNTHSEGCLFLRGFFQQFRWKSFRGQKPVLRPFSCVTKINCNCHFSPPGLSILF